MPYTYPPAAPTLSGDVVSINRFLNTPTLLARRLQDIASQRFVADFLLSGRVAVDGGAIQYENFEGLFTDRAVEQVTPGGEYPITTIAGGTAQVIPVVKWGQDTFVTDEAIKRQRMNAVDRALQKLANAVVKQVDSTALALIASTVTATRAAGAAWSTTTPTILRDIMLAKSDVAALNRGYDPNVLLVNDATWAYVASDPTLINAMRREADTNTVYTGDFPILAGLRIVASPNLPASGAWVVDTNFLGGIADEDLQGGYAGGTLQTKSMRDDDEDQWRLRARRVCVPYVTDPGAAIRITGV